MTSRRALVPGGDLYATFNENPQGRFNLDPIAHPNPQNRDVPIVSSFDRDPDHDDVATSAQICTGATPTVGYLSGGGYPRHQMMLLFAKGG